jgi:nitrous oxide reductase accessory protein NosL
MKRSSRIFAQIILATLLPAVSAARGEPVQVPDPEASATCPVCGMFVAKYPAWIATVLYKDGHAHHFDGPKDLFKYLLDMSRWAPHHRAQDIVAIAVTEYYGLRRIAARQAWYVVGSDVLDSIGPSAPACCEPPFTTNWT